MKRERDGLTIHKRISRKDEHETETEKYKKSEERLMDNVLHKTKFFDQLHKTLVFGGFNKIRRALHQRSVDEGRAQSIHPYTVAHHFRVCL